MTDQEREEFRKMMKKELDQDYHVFIYNSEDQKDMEFQMFSDHEIEPIELEKLKELVMPAVPTAVVPPVTFSEADPSMMSIPKT